MSSKVNKVKSVGILFITFILSFSAFALTGCEDENTKHYTLPSVEVGETFEIELLEYRSRGYLWYYEISGKSGIEFVSREVPPHDSDPDKIGGSGHGIYIFKATKAGNYKIRFALKKLNEPPKETNIYEIKVTKSK